MTTPSMSSIPFQPADEPLGHTAPLEYHARYPVLGIPVEFRTNSPAVIGVAERALGHWRDIVPELIAPIPAA
jgi:hypothetical protein